MIILRDKFFSDKKKNSNIIPTASVLGGTGIGVSGYLIGRKYQGKGNNLVNESTRDIDRINPKIEDESKYLKGLKDKLETNQSSLNNERNNLSNYKKAYKEAAKPIIRGEKIDKKLVSSLDDKIWNSEDNIKTLEKNNKDIRTRLQGSKES